MRRTYKRGAKARLSFSGGPHAPVNMADSMEEVNVGGKKLGNGTFAVLYCTIFRTPSFCKSFKFFGPPIAPLDPETIDLPAFYILSTMFTVARGPPEKVSLALVQRSNVLRVILKLAYTSFRSVLRKTELKSELAGQRLVSQCSLFVSKVLFADHVFLV